jgi:hypothetical protein
MQSNTWTNEVDNRVGVGIDGYAGDILIPCIVGGEWKEAVQARALACGDRSACVALAAVSSA